MKSDQRLVRWKASEYGAAMSVLNWIRSSDTWNGFGPAEAGSLSDAMSGSAFVFREDAACPSADMMVGMHLSARERMRAEELRKRVADAYPDGIDGSSYWLAVARSSLDRYAGMDSRGLSPDI